MKIAIRKFGNSHMVIIPKRLLAEIGARAEDKVDVSVKNGKIVIGVIKRRPRQGWAEDSELLAAAGNARLVWPEFCNEIDQNLKW